VFGHDVHSWASEFLSALAGASPLQPASRAEAAW
jgi:hypothetical protein